jgi:hydrogenase small subunit
VCTGCAVSLLGSVEPGIESVVPLLRLEFQETLMDGGAGTLTTDRLVQTSTDLSGQYILIVDGSVSYDDKADVTVLGATSSGFQLTAQDLISQLASRALAVVALGTCAAFGGIPSAAPNPGGHGSIARLVPPSKPFVRLPGCPPNPAWIIETLSIALTRGPGALDLDALFRPLSAYGQLLHDVCPRKSRYEANDFASAPGDPTRCLAAVGCKGPTTRADCPTRLWNGRSTCINANHPCMGCASPGFPDARTDAGAEGEVASSPFYIDP